jgi:hypothetical protein
MFIIEATVGWLQTTPTDRSGQLALSAPKALLCLTLWNLSFEILAWLGYLLLCVEISYSFHSA